MTLHGTHTCTHTQMHICTDTHAHAHTHTHTNTHTHAHTHTHTYTHIHTHTCTCRHMHTFTIQLHTHTLYTHLHISTVSITSTSVGSAVTATHLAGGHLIITSTWCHTATDDIRGHKTLPSFWKLYCRISIYHNRDTSCRRLTSTQEIS